MHSAAPRIGHSLGSESGLASAGAVLLQQPLYVDLLVQFERALLSVACDPHAQQLVASPPSLILYTCMSRALL